MHLGANYRHWNHNSLSSSVSSQLKQFYCSHLSHFEGKEMGVGLKLLLILQSQQIAIHLTIKN